jgi:hypothetical protein
VLVKGLPAESALARALGALQPGDWTVEAELLATLCEVAHGHASMFLVANSKKGTEPPRPLRIPRPSDPAEETGSRHATKDEVRAFFAGAVRYTPKGGDTP